jgi:hypothetical protein
VFGVPPELLGIMSKGGMNDSNFQQGRKRLYLETVLPFLDHIRDEFNVWLSPMYGDNIHIDYVRDDIEAIQEDRKLVFDRAVSIWTNGLAMRNEARKMIGMEPVDNGDVFLTPAGKQITGPDAEGHAEQVAGVQAILNPQPKVGPDGKPLPEPANKPGKPAHRPGKKSVESVEIMEHPLLTAGRELRDLI